MRTITVDVSPPSSSLSLLATPLASLTNLGCSVLGGGVPAAVITRLDPSLPGTAVEERQGGVVEEVVEGWFKADECVSRVHETGRERLLGSPRPLRPVL